MKYRQLIGIAIILIITKYSQEIYAQHSVEFDWILRKPMEISDYLTQEKFEKLGNELIVLYDEFNKSEEHKINCAKTTSNGSYFENYCQPVFIESEIKMNRKNWRDGNEGLKSIDEYYAANADKVAQMNDIFRLLLESNDRAVEIIEEIQIIRNTAIMLNKKINGESQNDEK